MGYTPIARYAPTRLRDDGVLFPPPEIPAVGIGLIVQRFAAWIIGGPLCVLLNTILPILGLSAFGWWSLLFAGMGGVWIGLSESAYRQAVKRAWLATISPVEYRSEELEAWHAKYDEILRASPGAYAHAIETADQEVKRMRNKRRYPEAIFKPGAGGRSRHKGDPLDKIGTESEMRLPPPPWGIPRSRRDREKFTAYSKSYSKKRRMAGRSYLDYGKHDPASGNYTCSLCDGYHTARYDDSFACQFCGAAGVVGHVKDGKHSAAVCSTCAQTYGLDRPAAVGKLADRPAANTMPGGHWYCTDNGITYKSTGGQWLQVTQDRKKYAVTLNRIEATYVKTATRCLR